MKFLNLWTVLLFTCLGVAKAQKDKVKVQFSGFVSAEAIWDSRQVVSARDGDVLLYPAPKVLDANGKDINADGGFNFVSVHTRLRAQTTPYNLWGGKLTALVEVDFAGTTNDKINLIRMRHAMMKFTKGKSTVIAGQYWHPMFVTSCFPGTSAWNAGLPLSVLSRNPQIRYTHAFDDKLRGSITALSQVDFKSNGPNGVSCDYLRNSSIPEFDAHLEYGDPSRFVCGAVLGTKELEPRQVNTSGNKVDESIRTYHALGYAKVKTDKMEYKLEGIYAQDGFNLLLLGGYGVSAVDANGKYSYEPIAISSVWGEIMSHYKKPVNFGLFAGYSKNLGAKKEILANEGLYARGTNIDNVWTVAPRVVFGYKKFQCMVELYQTFASYGTPNAKMKVENTDRVGNTRLQLHFKYSF